MILPCLKVLFFLSMLSSNQFVNAIDKSTYNEMPSEVHLEKFVQSVEKAVRFVEKNESVILELGMVMGIFLTNVNLKTILRNKRKFDQVPVEISQKIYTLERRTSDILDNYHETFSKYHSQMVRKIYSLFRDSTQWSDRLPSFHLSYKTLPIQNPTAQQLNEQFGDKYIHYGEVDSFQKWVPTPQFSDYCLLALSSNVGMSRKKPSKSCGLPVACVNVLKSGTDFGYALAHRILLLAVANLGLGCYVTGKVQDEQLALELCHTAFDEAQFIAMQEYNNTMDLLMEYATICSILGHTEFLRFDWMDEAIQRQSAVGEFVRRDAGQCEIMGKQCNPHFTGVSVPAISSAIRWIFENYYMPGTLYIDPKMPKLPFLRRMYLMNARHDQTNDLLVRQYSF